MQHGTNQTPHQWVTSQDGSIRFDATPLIELFELDEMAIKNGDLARQLTKAVDALALMLIEEPNMLPELAPIRYPLMKMCTTLRDVTQTATYNGK